MFFPTETVGINVLEDEAIEVVCCCNTWPTSRSDSGEMPR